jgi:hypothetical protein
VHGLQTHVRICTDQGLYGQGESTDAAVGTAPLVMPGDVVLGRNGAVIFIPPQLAEQVVRYSEETHLRDLFGHQRLQEGKYTAGQIDARWSEAIEQDYYQWLKQNEDHLPFPTARIEEILREHK